ncbi:MFS transporter [Castellaniella sp. FW104-16D08]|uniref:MFS transporter n=1 Tax=unclassified Castellaniella TaxID=2617606 RepID=UPI0033155534
MPATPSHAPDQASRLLKVTIALVGLFAFIQVYSIQSILPQLQRDLNASVVEIGNSVGMTVLAVALISPFVGMLSDAVGRKPLIIASVFLAAVPTGLMPMVDSVQGLLILRFLQGLAVPGVSVVAVAYIGEEFRSPLMVRMVSLYVSGCVFGGFLGRFLLGHLVEFMPWQSAFAIMAVLNLLGAVVVWRGLPDSRYFVPNARVKSSLISLGQLLRNPALQAACALGFSVFFALIGLFTFVNLHLAEPPYYFSSGQLANIFTVYLLGVLITPLSGRLIPRFGVRTTVLASLFTSAIGVALTLSVPSWLVVTGLAVAACGVFIIQSATMSFIAGRITQGRSLASGLYYSAYYCGGFTGAWLCGIGYAWGSWPGAVASLLLSQCVAAFIAWRFMPA